MLVYAVSLPLRAKTISAPIAVITDWLSRKLGQRISPASLTVAGDRRMQDGLSSRIEVSTTADATRILHCIVLSHADSNVHGRRWVTEIGLAHEIGSDTVSVSVVVSADDVSTRVRSPVSLRPPKLVGDLIESFGLTAGAPGKTLFALTEANASDVFVHQVQDVGRKHPIVIVSPAPDFSYRLDVTRLQLELRGLADVYQIPERADTWTISRAFTDVPAPYRGATAILFPIWAEQGTERVPAFLLTATDLEALADPVQEIVERIAHRMNLPMSWRHVSPDRVRRAYYEQEMVKRRQAFAATGPSGEESEYFDLLDKENDELRARFAEMTEERNREWERAEQLADDLRHEQYVEAELRKSLIVAQQAAGTGVDGALRQLVARVVGAKPSVSTALNLCEALFPDRLLILDSARKSAAAHQHFRYGDQVFGLLYRLAGGYFDVLSEGGSDGEARKVFGRFEFAAKEANLSNVGKEARTFSIDGLGDRFMEPHLKIQRGDNKAESFRCHFEWLADRRLIVIGHCGEHLPM